MQPLPVGETGGNEGKGRGRGGGSPGLHKPRTLDPGCGRLGKPLPLAELYPCPREGRSPFSFLAKGALPDG